MTGGTVVISIDAELMWGFHDLGRVPVKRVEHARESWINILDVLENYSIPATWAVVGHLFLDSCTGHHESHPAGNDWFKRDPGGRCTSDSLWFGRDLIEAILDSSLNHEIGSHSFSHFIFDENEANHEIAEAELRLAHEAATELDLKLRSFVFPRNQIGFRRLLAEYDYQSYRGLAPQRWGNALLTRKLAKLVTFSFGISSPPIVTPEIDEYGLVNIPASMFLYTFEGPIAWITGTYSQDPVVRQVENGLLELKDRPEGVLHLWLHPNNLTSERDLERLTEVVATIAEYIDKFDISISTMFEVAQQVRDTA